MKRGISLVVLVITIIILATLLTTVTISGFAMYNNSLRTSIATELNMVQIAVDNYYNKNNLYPIKRSIQVDLSGVNSESKSQFDLEGIVDNKIVLEEIDYNALNLKTLKYGLGEQGLNDVYGVSSKTGKVYYVKGIAIGNYTYYTLNDELKKFTEYEHFNEMTNNEDGIVFIPDNIEWTNDDINVSIKIPKTVVVTDVLNGTTHVSNNISDDTDYYYIYNVEGIDSNRDIVVKYTVDRESKEAKYNVSNIDKISPTLSIDENQELMVSVDDKYAYSSLDVTDDLSDIKVIKYENDIIGDNTSEGILNIETYFKTAGNIIYTNTLQIEPNVKKITVYVEDNAGNWKVEYVTVKEDVYIALSN